MNLLVSTFIFDNEWNEMYEMKLLRGKVTDARGLVEQLRRFLSSYGVQ